MYGPPGGKLRAVHIVDENFSVDDDHSPVLAGLEACQANVSRRQKHVLSKLSLNAPVIRVDHGLLRHRDRYRSLLVDCSTLPPFCITILLTNELHNCTGMVWSCHFGVLDLFVIQIILSLNTNTLLHFCVIEHLLKMKRPRGMSKLLSSGSIHQMQVESNKNVDWMQTRLWWPIYISMIMVARALSLFLPVSSAVQWTVVNVFHAVVRQA
jgi:hypothetical protein